MAQCHECGQEFEGEPGSELLRRIVDHYEHQHGLGG